MTFIRATKRAFTIYRTSLRDGVMLPAALCELPPFVALPPPEGEAVVFFLKNII